MSAPLAPPLDLSPGAPAWDELHERLLPNLSLTLARRYRARYGASPEDAVSSAVRILLQRLDERSVAFPTLGHLAAWLLRVASHKLRDHLDREHLDRRRDLPHAEAPGNAIQASCDEAFALLDRLRARLAPEVLSVLDGRLADRTLAQIASDNGWTRVRAESLNRTLNRRVERLLAEEA